MTPPGDQVAYLVCLLLSFPLSYIYWTFFLPKKGMRLQKQLYFGVFGHLFLFLLFLPNYHQSAVHNSSPFHWLLHVYLPTLFTFGWCWMMRGKRWMPYVNFAFLLSFSSYLHWCRYKWQYGEYRLDHITVVMLLVIKLSSFAFDINDAYRKRSPVHGKKPSIVVKIEDPRLETLKNNYYPNILEFLAYCFMYSNVLTGPAVFYPEFKSFLDGTYFNSKIGESKSTSPVTFLDHSALDDRRKRIRSLFLKAIFFIALHLVLMDRVPAPSFLITEKFANLPLIFKLPVLHMINIGWRTKYYLAWLLAECAHVILGFGYRCVTKTQGNVTTVHHAWDRLEIVDPIKVESANSFRHTLNEWHKTTNAWLYRYVYLRCGFLNAERGKPGFRANLVTKFVSALWHGVYPGYYLMFGTAALFTWASHLTYRTLSWPSFIPTCLHYWISLLINYVLSDYVIATFELWPLKDSLSFYRAYNYLGHIIIIGTILILKFVVRPIKTKQHVQ